MKTGFVFMMVLVIVAMLLVGCAVSRAPTGAIEVRVTDKPPEYGEIEKILVTVVDSEEAIMVHKVVAEQEQLGGGNWINIPVTGDNIFDLLELKEQGVDLLLGSAEVSTGKYTQIRMTIEEVTVIFDDGTEQGKPEKAKLPSGQLKFVRPFDVVEGETTILLLDFDADKSVTITGKGDVIFKPVLKLVVSSKESGEETPDLLVAYDQSVTTDEDTAVDITLTASDADGGTLAYSVVTLPSHGTMSGTAPNLTYTPEDNWSGQDSFTFRLTVDGLDSNIAAVTITINPVDDPPILNTIGDKTIKEGELLTFTNSATDPDSDNLTYSASNLPNGASFNPTTRQFSWKPTYNQAGIYNNIRFEVSDGNNNVFQTITINVINVTTQGGGGGGGGGVDEEELYQG